RDLAEDCARGRLYLPREELELQGVPVDDPALALRHPGLAAVCRRVAEMALRHYEAADAAMAECDRNAMRPASVMSAVYRATLERLMRRGWERVEERVSLPAPVKLYLAIRH